MPDDDYMFSSSFSLFFPLVVQTGQAMRDCFDCEVWWCWMSVRTAWLGESESQPACPLFFFLLFPACLRPPTPVFGWRQPHTALASGIGWPVPCAWYRNYRICDHLSTFSRLISCASDKPSWSSQPTQTTASCCKPQLPQPLEGLANHQSSSSCPPPFIAPHTLPHLSGNRQARNERTEKKAKKAKGLPPHR